MRKPTYREELISLRDATDYLEVTKNVLYVNIHKKPNWFKVKNGDKFVDVGMLKYQREAYYYLKEKAQLFYFFIKDNGIKDSDLARALHYENGFTMQTWRKFLHTSLFATEDETASDLSQRKYNTTMLEEFHKCSLKYVRKVKREKVMNIDSLTGY